MSTLAELGIKTPYALAPMAGTTDTSFRSLCCEFGAGWVVTELVSARGIIYDQALQKSMRYLRYSEHEHPIAVQLFGATPEDFAGAIEILSKQEFAQGYDFIDINMGCPVNKVVKTGAGSALMRTPDIACAICEAAVKAATTWGKQVTCKIRTGWNEQQINCVELAKALEQTGIVMLTVHGRTREQMYAGKANWQLIKAVKDSVKIPVWGNGDVHDLRSAEAMFNETKVDGVMIGRGAQGKPWIFAELKGLKLTANEKLNAVKKHLQRMCESLGEDLAVREFRSQLSFYTKGIPGAAKLRQQIFQLKNREEIIQVLEQINWQ